MGQMAAQRAEQLRQPTDGRSDAYLIIKRGLYYKPRACGYTGIRDHAGRYTLAEVAVCFPNLESENQDGMSFIHEDDAPEFTPACFHDLKADHLQKQRDEARQHAAAAWEAAAPIRSLIELTECGEITGLHWADEFGLYLLGDDDEPVYCAVKLTFEQLGKIAPTSPPAALSAALQARLDAEIDTCARECEMCPDEQWGQWMADRIMARRSDRKGE